MKNALLTLPMLLALSTSTYADAQPPTDVFPPGTDLGQLRIPESLDQFESIPALDVQHPLLASTPPADSSARRSAAVPPPPVNLLSGEDVALSAADARAVALAKDWVSGSTTTSPGRGDGGSILFRFGSTMPAVVCSPLKVCSIALQAGESVNQVEVGDPVRWRVTPAYTGTGPTATTHVVVKPTDIGLSTNMIVATDRRLYNLRLVSRRDEWMPALSFSYPEDEQALWAAQANARAAERAATVIEETGQTVTNLDFAYKIRGDKATWRPLRVYHDGRQTFVQFPAAATHDELPALVALGAGDAEELVNYRLRGSVFVVDKVLRDALLVSGVGRHQERVSISYAGGE